MTIVQRKHIVAYCLQLWGHLRPLITLCARLVQLRPHVYVTFLCSTSVFERVCKELARCFDDGAPTAEEAQRMRVIAIGDVAAASSPNAVKVFTDVWQALLREEDLTCQQTGTQYGAMPKPLAAVIDFMAIPVYEAMRSLKGDKVKIFAWVPAMQSPWFHFHGPRTRGGLGNVRAQVEDEVRRTGRTYEEIALEIGRRGSGKVIKVPGLPMMHDYENNPQDYPVPSSFYVDVFPKIHEAMEMMDGLLMASSTSYEPEAVAETKAWMRSIGRFAYVTGPLLPSTSRKVSAKFEKRQSLKPDRIQTFLDETLVADGERSLLYISFGSLYWPSSAPEKLWAFIDVVMERKIPFILGHASPLASIPNEARDKIEAYGKALLCPWTPQQLILNHPATGWLLYHGGMSGVLEAISAGIPLILWPAFADQEANAIMLSEKHRVGYELLEVRTGMGLRPICRTGYVPVGTVEAVRREARDVLARAFGADGARKRKRMGVLRRAVMGEWDAEGESRRDVCAFLDSL
ncbi:UDP-Glycosyltransferase/glycogen phosphorylase [Epithele typhae]|uniref:UDP-Glycosyltransferase/glycogen phosphorylase n=1 Tax=Epithele typhae TaxID=378194 RepID=UPI002007FE5B|nr:UDP-Glycosyltransferase/glycogen phosphorylase [Epithele typhae]KAH9940519.1 UDP-Glycosyltransferase/glycogen phosphorylase [Epithele typhae]